MSTPSFQRFTVPDDIVALCRAHLPPVAVEPVVAALRPSVRLVTRETGSIEVGASHLGGDPDLPDDVEWPRFAGYPGTRDAASWRPHIGTPLTFLAQIDLSVTAPLDLEGLLPDRGWLVLFHLEAFAAFDRWPPGGDPVRLLWLDVEREALRPRLAPAGVRDRWHRVELEPRQEWTLPMVDDLERPEGMDTDTWVDHWDAIEAFGEPLAAHQGFEPDTRRVSRHRMLGHPQLIQSPGVAEGTRLVLQIDCDPILPRPDTPRTGIKWGDAGRLFVLGTDDALRERRWGADAVSAFVEMH